MLALFVIIAIVFLLPHIFKRTVTETFENRFLPSAYNKYNIYEGDRSHFIRPLTTTTHNICRTCKLGNCNKGVCKSIYTKLPKKKKKKQKKFIQVKDLKKLFKL